MRTEEAAFFKGVCIACGGGFHGLQASLRAFTPTPPTDGAA